MGEGGGGVERELENNEELENCRKPNKKRKTDNANEHRWMTKEK